MTIAAPSVSTSMRSAVPGPAALAESPKFANSDYDPRVRMRNMTALNAARAPLAAYLVAIASRIHPIFCPPSSAGASGGQTRR